MANPKTIRVNLLLDEDLANRLLEIKDKMGNGLRTQDLVRYILEDWLQAQGA